MSGSDFQVVDARPDHLPFLAWVVQEAARSHLEKSSFDFFVDGPPDEVLRFVETLFTTEARHWGRLANFLIAESDGQPMAAVCGYYAEDVDGGIMVQGGREAGLKLGWTEERLAAGYQRVGSIIFLAFKRAERAWIIEAVATRPEARRTGLVTHLIARMLERGRQRGAEVAEISVYIGNDAAQRAYEKTGFVVVDEARHPLFESVYGCPGMRLMRRPL